MVLHELSQVFTLVLFIFLSMYMISQRRKRREKINNKQKAVVYVINALWYTESKKTNLFSSRAVVSIEMCSLNTEIYLLTTY